MGKQTDKLLEITIDDELNFDEQIKNIYIRANRKLTILTKMRKYLGFTKARLLSM